MLHLQGCLSQAGNTDHSKIYIKGFHCWYRCIIYIEFLKAVNKKKTSTILIAVFAYEFLVCLDLSQRDQFYHLI